MWPEHSESLLSSSSLEKRKREAPQAEVPCYLNHSRIVPPHIQSLGHVLHRSYLGSLEQPNGCPPRLQFFNRKRRALPQKGYVSSQCFESAFAPQYREDTPQNLLMAHQALSPANATVSPTAVSPRTIVPAQLKACASPSLLRACHICHRRPTTKELLEAYADCELCGQRACFVCLRQCDAPGCCGPNDQQNRQRWGNTPDSIDSRDFLGFNSRRICSYCAVEAVTEAGEEAVQCLVCIKQISDTVI
ncbi:hypothetical protein BDV19DRAFT_36511 [Aspergillus venezuelensis]